jgi:hypothetical protein
MAAPKQFNLDSIHYYFSLVQKDHADARSYGRKLGEFAALQKKIAKLPDAEFDVAMQTLSHILADAAGDEKERAESTKQKSRRTS